MSDEEKLLPCPFCGGRAALRHEDDAWTPECLLEKQTPEREHGYIDFPWYWEKADAVKAWNMRHPSPLVWSSERPKVSGRYLHRHVDDKEAIHMDFFDASDLFGRDNWYASHEFAGPIPEPMEPPSC